MRRDEHPTRTAFRFAGNQAAELNSSSGLNQRAMWFHTERDIDTGGNTLTGEGLAEVLQGAAVVVDVSNSPARLKWPVLNSSVSMN